MLYSHLVALMMAMMAVDAVFVERKLIGHTKAADMFATVVIKNIISEEKYNGG